MDAKKLIEMLDAMDSKYKGVLKRCYDALAEDTDQGVRDAVREAIEPYIKGSKNGEE